PLLFLLTVLISGTALSQENYYYYKGKKIPLEIRKSKLGINSSELQKIQNYRLTKKNLQTIVINEENPEIVEIIFQNDLTENEYIQEKKELKDKGIINVFPFYKKNSYNTITTSSQFYIKLREQSDLEKLKEIADILKVEILGSNEFMPLWYKLDLNN